MAAFLRFAYMAVFLHYLQSTLSAIYTISNLSYLQSTSMQAGKHAMQSRLCHPGYAYVAAFLRFAYMAAFLRFAYVAAFLRFAYMAAQSTLCNLCCAIQAMQSGCNLGYAIYAMQSRLCNVGYAI